MAKKEERVERVIRGLLKLPENRRCINCNSLGPQYVCTTFFTFVCTSCSGIHREFTHRVKSVSMAKFNAAELDALQAGGNERARQIYFKNWDPQRNFYPDVSNLQGLRDFIKNVYVDRIYTGEKSQEKLPRIRLGDKEEPIESRKVGVYCGGYRSPSYEDRCEQTERFGAGGRNEDKHFKYYYDERRSPRYAKENSRYGGYKKKPARIEVVDDRFRDDANQKGRKSDGQRFVHRESRLAIRSPDHQKNMDRSSFPVVGSVRDILGNNVPPLQVGKHPKANDRKDGDGSAHNQMIISYENMASIDRNPVQQESQNSESLIDLNTDSKPSDAAAAPETLENSTSGDGDNCSSHESSTKENTPPAPEPNTLEFLLLELSVPVVPANYVYEIPSNDNPSSTATGGNMLMSSGVSEAVPPEQMLTLPNSDGSSTTVAEGMTRIDNVLSDVAMGQVSTLPNSAGASTAVSGGNMLVPLVSTTVGVVPPTPMGETLTLLDIDTFDPSSTPSASSLPLPEQPSNGDPLQAPPNIIGESTFMVLKEEQVSGMQQHQSSALPVAGGVSTGQQTTTTPVGPLQNQLWTSMNVANAQERSNALADHTSYDVSKAAQETLSGASQSLPVDTKSSGRKELPMDLFTASYSPVPSPIPGWQTGTRYGMGYNMQCYPTAMSVPAYPHPLKSTNPFDLYNESISVQAPLFSSMGDLRDAPPSMSAPGALLHCTGFGGNSSGLMTAQSPSYAPAVPAQSPSLVAAISPGAYMGQVDTNMPPSRPLGAGGFGNNNDPFGSLDMAQLPARGYSLPTSPSSFPPKGGNPFG